MHPKLGPFENLRINIHGNHEVCDRKSAGQNCTKLDRITYMFGSGPKELKSTNLFVLSKLLFTIDKVGLKIFENSEMEYFQAAHIVVSRSDNFLRFIYEKYMAYIVESGISLVFIKYCHKIIVSNYAWHLKWKTNYLAQSNISENTLFIYAMRWLQNDCFSFYSKEKCDLKIDEHN